MSELPRSTEVLIVGAGPVGLTLAASLEARGVDVALVDKAAERTNTSRAAVIHARTLEALHGIGVTDELVRRGIIVPRFTVRDRDRALLTIDFDGLPTRHPYTLMLPQDITEDVLTRRLDELGGHVRRPYELARLDQDAAGVTATMLGGETLRASYVVGADGMHSAVREQAGIGFAGESYGQSFVLADVHLDWEFDDTEVMLYLSPAGLVVAAPLPGGRHRIVATVDDAPERPDRDHIQALLDARGPQKRPAQVKDVVWSSRFRVHHRLADRYREGRVFLAGDAAHVHSPAGGQGMNTGIQDAVALAARLAGVLRDGADERILDEYEAERRPVAADVVALTHRATLVATVDISAVRRLRNAALRVLDRIPAVRRKLALNISGLAIDRRHGDGPAGGPSASGPASSSPGIDAEGTTAGRASSTRSGAISADRTPPSARSRKRAPAQRTPAARICTRSANVTASRAEPPVLEARRPVVGRPLTSHREQRRPGGPTERPGRYRAPGPLYSR